jgi:ribosomal protein L24E
MRTEDCRLLTFNYETSSRTRMKMHEVVKQNRKPDKVKWTAKVKIETI